MTAEKKLGRLAGLLYLVVVITGIFSLVYVPSQISTTGDPQATADAVLASEALFRWGIAAFLVKQVAFLILPLVLFRLLRAHGEAMATLMVALAVVSVPIALISLASRLDALALLTDARHAAAWTQQQLQAEAALALNEYRNGLFITNLFWGLWLYPLGHLILRSRLLPRALGVLLILGCFGYLVDVFGELLIRNYADSGIARFVLLPASFGEIGTCLWLLACGAREPRRGTA